MKFIYIPKEGCLLEELSSFVFDTDDEASARQEIVNRRFKPEGRLCKEAEKGTPRLSCYNIGGRSWVSI